MRRPTLGRPPLGRPFTAAIAAVLAVAAATTATAAAATTDAPAATAARARTAASPASSFRLFDDTSYNDDNLASYGITPANVVYDSWDMSCSNVATFTCSLAPESEYKAKIAAIDKTIPPTAPLTLDFEGLDATSGTPAEEAANDFEAWEQIIAWTRQVIPASQPLGTYSYDWDQTPAEIADNAQLHHQGLTFFVPSMYTYTANLDAANYAAWTSRLDEAIANDEQADPDQPIYPFIWPQWDTTGGAYMDGTSWAEELGYLKTHTQGAIIWGGGEDLTSAACGWVSSTRQFMAQLTGRGTDTGPLTADIQYPGTCLLTRGQTTSVPVTITNSGTAATPATTLGVSAAPGVSGVPAAGQVPALAPGASWSTTLSVSVGWNVPLGDTTLTVHLGSGVQHSTAIINDTDLALGMPATQSSTNGTDTASLAVDGNTDPAIADGSVSQTDSQPQPWWQVDLGRSRHIGAVALYAASGAPSVANYYVIVSDNPDASAPATPIPPDQWLRTQPGTWAFFATASDFRTWQYEADTYGRSLGSPTIVSAGLAGRYVRIQLAGTGQLSLAEVEVRPGAPDGPIQVFTDRVANGGFDSGSLAPWTTSGSAGLTSGGGELQLSPAASGQQVIAVRPDTRYTLSGFGELSAAGGQAQIGVQGYGGPALTAPVTGTIWDEGTVTFTTGPHTTSATVFLRDPAGSTATATFTNITAVVAGTLQ
jgi:hypothetical protein